MNRTFSPWRRALGVAAMLGTLGACSESSKLSSGGGDFADQLDDICRQVRRDVRDIGASDPAGYAAALVAIVDQANEDIGELEPAKADQDSFDEFTENLDDQSSSVQKIATALVAGDVDGANDELDQFVELAADNAEIAEDLDADRCTDMFAAVEFPSGTPPTVATAPPESSAPDTTTAETTGDTVIDLPITNPPETEPPATTAPPETTPPETAPPQTVPMTTMVTSSETQNLGDFYLAPLGYEWDGELTNTLLTVFAAPSDDPTIGPNLLGYGIGAAEATDGSGLTALVLVAELDSEFTVEQQDAYYLFEGVSGGEPIQTPDGFYAWFESSAESGETYDILIAFFGSAAVTVRQGTGGNPSAVLDAFVAANSG